MTENNLTISQLADAIGALVNTLKTLRHRGYWVAWDGGADDVSEDAGWRRYSAFDAALTGSMIELIDAGLSAKAASSIINNMRGGAVAAKHPPKPSDDDIWLGVVRLEEGAAHIGGRLPEVLRDATRHIRRDIDNFDGGGSAIILVNVSRHVRRVRAALDVGGE